MTRLDQSALDLMERVMAQDAPLDARLNETLRVLSKWRAQKLANTVVAREGRTVRSGPFAGLVYGTQTEGALSARLLGCYEASLAPVIDEIIRTRYPRIIDIGSAEGYYAVGLAMRMPATRIAAHDANPRAREFCAALAERNGVADRVTIGGELDHGAFGDCADIPTAVICDIEGAEVDLLDPGKAPGLCHADILVECHDLVRRGTTETLAERFRATHAVRRFGRTLCPEALPEWTEILGDLDRLLMLWEWRAGPTPWLWMKALDRPPLQETAA